MAQSVCNGIQIAFDDTEFGSSKPPIVFIHGNTLNRSMWDKQKQSLRAANRVVTYDLRGHGGSEKPITGYSREEEVKDLKDLLDVVRAPKSHLVGLSRGAGIALSFAAAHPGMVSSVFAMSPSFDHDRHLPDFANQRLDVMATLRGEGLRAAKEKWLSLPLFTQALEDEEVAARIDQLMLSYTGAHWLDEQPPKDPSLGDAASSITARTLIMVGEKEAPGYHACADELVEKISGSEKKVMPDVGHLISMEASDETTAAIETFVLGKVAESEE
ncbi:MAG: alpha/beta hydrolase [Nitrospinaceae bacterium]|nr:alpha/beta hydrolase [Nitrospinaceae bacterium]MBT3435594.1 alpha/beta hydrolase [Nitrospinaceae bacterium]MBT3823237.1 alpha/beta hydrolase [Nitrospinaceae bacterium]MBT4429215.1 alpha/beta hydrolase [Nitrospinaceae bacterium]MBT5946994.1 alpha/beta hydrolase [Nitrospinaceae bacterium]